MSTLSEEGGGRRERGEGGREEGERRWKRGEVGFLIYCNETNAITTTSNTTTTTTIIIKLSSFVSVLIDLPLSLLLVLLLPPPYLVRYDVPVSYL